MKRRRHDRNFVIMLGLMVMILVVVETCDGQGYQITQICEGNKCKDARGYFGMDLMDSTVTIMVINGEFEVYRFKKCFRIKGITYFELNTIGSRSFLWQGEYTQIEDHTAKQRTEFTLNHRYQKKPEHTKRYRCKKL